MVRDGRVWLKTLGGLRPVDVIPAAGIGRFLRPAGAARRLLLGIPGLLQAVRGGHVALANALGSGLIENPGLAAFLPMLCRHLLGEDLKLPSRPPGGAATRPNAVTYWRIWTAWWCARSWRTGRAGTVVSSMRRPRGAGRANSANPYRFVGQEPLPLSTAPVLEGAD